MNSRLLGRILEAQRTLYVKSKDRILFVVTRDFAWAPISEVFADYPYEIVIIPKVSRPSQDYPLNEELLDGKTLAWLISNISISHSPATRKMMERGMFLVSNPGVTEDWLAILDPANRRICQQNANRIMRLIGGDIGGRIRVTADDGTNLELWVPNGNWSKEVGNRGETGTNGVYGEVVTAPYRAEGFYVLKPGDFLTNPINRVESEIRLVISHNHVTDIRGKAQARILHEMLVKAGDAKAFCLGEFAFGTNPGKPARVQRSVVAEKLARGIHIAIGSNSVCLKKDCPEINMFPYGRYSAGVHIDAIKFGARVTFNEKPIL